MATPARDNQQAPADARVQLNERLEKIRSQPKLQSQQQTAVVLKAVEDTLQSQQSEPSPTAYFSALQSILDKSLSQASGFTNKDVATAVVYLLDLFTPHVPAPLLRSNFSRIHTGLNLALGLPDVDAPFLRPAIGCLEALLVAQDGPSWAHEDRRKALVGLLNLSMDHRPKVRKRAQDAVKHVLQQAPPGPSLEHPAADMCAETTLRNFERLAAVYAKEGRQSGGQNRESELIHVMQLIKTIAKAAAGWPSRSLDSLCEVLFSLAKSRSEFLSTNAFDVFDAVFECMARDTSFERLSRLVDSILELQPSPNDTQLLPPWIAVVSRGYDVMSQLEPEETFQKLPTIFVSISQFLASSSYNIRVSASECLVSFMFNCIPGSAILEPSIFDEKTLEKLGQTVLGLFDVKYQSAWMEIFDVAGAVFENMQWRADPVMLKAIQAVGDLRDSPSFQNKGKADELLAKAVRFVGPEKVLQILPLNITPGKHRGPGRAWLLPLLRDNTANTNLSHFKQEMIPMSEKLFQLVMKQGSQEKTTETKIFETLVNQIWSCLPGYCDRPLDMTDAFDQGLAEMISKLLYQQPDMRMDLCKALQSLVDSFSTISDFDGEEDLIAQGRISKAQATQSLVHLGKFSSNILAVLFNVYGETVPQNRGPVLSCINAYLSVTSPKELSDTFERVVGMLETTIQTPNESSSHEKKSKQNKMPPLSHALMDIVVAMAIHLPRESYQKLFSVATAIISQQSEPQLQKKAFKLIPRLEQCEIGQLALQERNSEIQQLLLQSSESTVAPARRDRLHAISSIIKTLPPQDLYFIPSIVPEVILRTKETNERTREAAFALIVQMGEKMKQGGTIENSRVNNASADAPTVTASLDEYFTVLSAGLAGTTPHMISAAVTSISRALFEFHKEVSEASLAELLSTMDLFLQSPTREVVRSVLGLVKVCITSLPRSFMRPRLPSLIPHLISWSHEHKNDFRPKVRNLLDRIMRHFGVEILEQNCPAEDRKLITNIRKTRERQKKKKSAPRDDQAAGDDEAGQQNQAKYENEFDEAIYGSDDSDLESAEEDEAEQSVSRKKSRGKGPQKDGAFIHEDDDEPLDLLDRRALANISSTKPLKTPRQPRRSKAKTDLDGKLVLREEENDDAEMMDMDDGGKGAGKGVDAYVEAIRGKHAPKRGQRGKLKFSNKPSRGDDDDFDDAEESAASGKGQISKPKRHGNVKAVGRGGAGRSNSTRGGRVGKRGMKTRR